MPVIFKLGEKVNTFVPRTSTSESDIALPISVPFDFTISEDMLGDVELVDADELYNYFVKVEREGVGFTIVVRELHNNSWFELVDVRSDSNIKEGEWNTVS